MNVEPNNLNDDGLNRTDISEGADLSPDKAKRSSRKKKLVMLVSLLLLLMILVSGGYLLLGEKQLQVKATQRPTEKITNGADLQKAAYDSLKGLIDAPAPSLNQSIPAGRSPSPTPTMDRSETTKTSAPIQSGIAMTIAPPPEAQDGRGQRAADAGIHTNQTVNPNGAATSLTASAAKPKVGSSITLASLPVKVVAKPDDQKPNDHTAVRSDGGKPSLKRTRTKSAPSFGAMLPVRLMGVLYTLRAGSLVRLELARDIQSEGWVLKRGTVFVGAVLGGELDRAYVQIKGFIDPDTQGFVRLEGELLGNDGGAGLRGKRRRVSSVWGKVFDRLAQSGTQILTSILGRQSSSVIVATDPYGTYRSTNGADSSQDNRSFVEVPAGEVGFVLVTALPEAERADSHLANRSNLEDPPETLLDAELAQLLAEADPAQIRAALPRMNPELRRVAEMVLREIETANE
jgi:cytoskeletal protein RodZ